MKLRYAIIPVVIGSMALASWVALEPGFAQSSPAAIPHSPIVIDEIDGPTVVVGESNIELDSETGFAMAAFPPTMSDTEWHADAWFVNSCLDCHETGVQDAPEIRHIGLPEIALDSKCRSCHVLIQGQTKPIEVVPEFDPETGYASWAFPPMMPNNFKHIEAWGDRNCMMCHEDGTLDAPVVKHDRLPQIALVAQCRSCHVQVRSHESSPWPVLEPYFD